MISVFLFRHGQAGTRDDYDRLSVLGQEQSRLLGEFLARRDFHFDAVYCGSLERQRRTCKAVVEACRRFGKPFPEAIIDPRWNEFDIARVFREIAPRLAASDGEFRAHYQRLQEDLQHPVGSAHRQWTKADNLTVHAWIEGACEFSGESWEDFRQRVLGCRDSIAALPDGARVAVFTSATPIAIWIGEAHALPAWKIMELAAVQVNTSFTSVALEDSEIRLTSFNEKPHLGEERLLTCR